jgi:hypothetical protein
MAHTACLVCLVSSVSGHHKDALGRGSISSGQITKFQQSTLLQVSMALTLQSVSISYYILSTGGSMGPIYVFILLLSKKLQIC